MVFVQDFLRDIEEKGGAIVPSLWCDDIDVARIPQWFETFNTDKLVIKPDVGGNATDTFVLRDPLSAELTDQLSQNFRQRAFRVQEEHGSEIRSVQPTQDLIEPSLYLRTDDGAAARFAAAFDKYFEECKQ